MQESLIVASATTGKRDRMHKNGISEYGITLGEYR